MAIDSDWCSCAKCHAGYGWKNAQFDFSNTEKMDCLICHDTTGNYSKLKKSCGRPKKGLDLTRIAKQVGLPGRSNCGACHWYGGGGDNAKHGDMGSDLADPAPELDVHMGKLDFTCQECHYTDHHKISGSSTSSAVSEGSVACVDCHDPSPHDSSYPLLQTLNRHGKTIACQTCHIPRYAVNKFTLTHRDGSQPSKKKELVKKNQTRKEVKTPMGYKVFEKDLKPDYTWYNGYHNRYLKGEPVDLSGITSLNPPVGSIKDPSAKITPYKIIHTRQAADARYGYLIIPHISGKDGLFATQDWQLTAEKGMKAAGLKFSGKIAFPRTKMYWRLNHGVVPKEKALSCLDCHGPSGVMDFKSLGYEGDPMETGIRFPQGKNNSQN